MGIVDAYVFGRFLSIFNIIEPLPMRMLWARTLLESTMQGPAVGAAVLAVIVWAASALWTVAAWGAFRLGFQLSRVRAFAATLLWLALLAGLTQLLVFASAG